MVLFPAFDSNPISDLTGKYSASGQLYEKVWFLAGTFGGRAERICQIPSGRAIFFPIINDIISFATDPHLKTGEELRKYAKKDLDNVKFLSARLDGIEIGNLECYRVQTSMFEIKLPNGQSGDLLPTKAISERLLDIPFSSINW